MSDKKTKKAELPKKQIRRHRTKAKKGQRGQGFDMEKARRDIQFDQRYGLVPVE
jgi:hypothetical protein